MGEHPTISDAASAWLDHIQTRRRSPIKPSSSATFKSYIAKWIDPQLGHFAVEQVGIKVMRDFISVLNAEGLSPKSQTEIAGTVKSIIASVCDEEGEPLYPRTWDNTRLDLPLVSIQRQPTVTTPELEAIISAASESDAALWALAAGSGARIGEILALRIGPTELSSCWTPETCSLTIRTSLWRGREQAPKTENAHRTIEIAEPLNTALMAFAGKRTGFLLGNGLPLKETTARSHLDRLLPGRGFHSMRRYRATVLRGSMVVPEDIIRFWMGHGDGSITSRYSKLSADANLRRRLCDKIGLGFRLPGDSPQ